MDNISLEGLSDQQRELVTRLVDVLRESRSREARAELGRLLDKLASRPSVMTASEAEALALEAVAYARGHTA